MNLKIIKSVAVAMLFSMLAGCIVLSVYPFYSAGDLIFDPGLTGRWVKSTSTNEFWEFAAAGEKSYTLTTTDANETNIFEAHLFQLEKHQFLDLLTTNRSEFELPLHLVTKVSRSDTNLSLPFLDYGWLAKFLETNPAAVRHIVVPEKPGDTNSQMVYLTSNTRELQKFLLKHIDDTNAFGGDSAIELNRVSP